jgi:N-acetylglucosamine kinase-like BadF-type ATPase
VRSVRVAGGLEFIEEAETPGMQHVLAVDGGNTKTIALVAALDGTIVGIGRGGCSDIYNAEPLDGTGDRAAAARANAEGAISAALAQAGLTRSDLVVGVFNMAGADWPEDIAFWRESMSERGYGQRVIAQNDALGALYLASPEPVGVSIVCGSGVATGARAADGRVWHSSFWQDEAQGSYHMGQKLLFAVYRSALGIEPPTSLTRRVLDYFGVATVEDVLHLFHNRLRPTTVRTGLLAPILLDEADAGDAAALRIVREHGAALGNIALAVGRQVGLEGGAIPLILTGGMFRHPTTVFEDAIVERVQVAWPAIRPLRSPAEPIVGVLIEALAAAGAPPELTALDRLLAAFPAAAVFSTRPL